MLLTTVAGCLLLHELQIRRTSWLRPLFGLKPRRPGAEDARGEGFTGGERSELGTRGERVTGIEPA